MGTRCYGVACNDIMRLSNVAMEIALPQENTMSFENAVKKIVICNE